MDGSQHQRGWEIISWATTLSHTSLVPDECACCRDGGSGGEVEPTLSRSPAAVALLSGSVFAASVGEGQVGQCFGQSLSCSLPHRLTVLPAVWTGRHEPTSLSLGGRMDGRINAQCPLRLPPTAWWGSGQHVQMLQLAGANLLIVYRDR